MTEAEARILEAVEKMAEAVDRMADEQHGTNAVLLRIEALLSTNRPKAPAKRKDVAPAIATTGGDVWSHYALAYHNRYRVAPIRNAKTNAICSNLVKRLGKDAPDIASYYVAHSDRLYVNARHSLDLLVRDAEKMHTDWKRGHAATSREAYDTERLSTAKSQMDRIEKGEL